MNYQRTIYEDAPVQIEVPPALRHRRVEVIFLALDEEVDNGANGASVSDQGWPSDFVASTAGQFAGAPLVRAQPTYEARLELP